MLNQFYDGNGMRYEKIVNGVKTNYYWNEDQLIMESKNGSRTYYIYGVTGIEGMIVEKDLQDTYYYFDKNTLGDVIAIRNEYGNVIATYEYDAWGNHTVYNASGNVDNNQSSIGNINPFRYRGYYYDVETGFYYLQTRYYDPTICRFINADNYELVAELSQTIGQLNLYAYANNNPIMLTDETGESAFLIASLIISFAIGFGASIGNQALQYGWDDISVLQASIDGAVAMFSVGLASTGISIGASIAIGAVMGGLQYTVNSTLIRDNFTWHGLAYATAFGALSGAMSGAGAKNAGALAQKIAGKNNIASITAISSFIQYTGSGVVSYQINQEFIKAFAIINGITIGTLVDNSIRNLLIVK